MDYQQRSSPPSPSSLKAITYGMDKLFESNKYININKECLEMYIKMFNGDCTRMSNILIYYSSIDLDIFYFVESILSEINYDTLCICTKEHQIRTGWN